MNCGPAGAHGVLRKGEGGEGRCSPPRGGTERTGTGLNPRWPHPRTAAPPPASVPASVRGRRRGAARSSVGSHRGTAALPTPAFLPRTRNSAVPRPGIFHPGTRRASPDGSGGSGAGRALTRIPTAFPSPSPSPGRGNAAGKRSCCRWGKRRTGREARRDAEPGRWNRHRSGQRRCERVGAVRAARSGPEVGATGTEAAPNSSPPAMRKERLRGVRSCWVSLPPAAGPHARCLGCKAVRSHVCVRDGG